MLNEFKKFIFKGNVIDLSTGVIIGAAFGKIVTALTDGIITPLLNLLGGDPNVPWKAGPFDLGIIISAAISFLITAAVIFFVIIKPVNKLMALTSKPEAAPEPEAPPADIQLLTEIRDLLKK